MQGEDPGIGSVNLTDCSIRLGLIWMEHHHLRKMDKVNSVSVSVFCQIPLAFPQQGDL